jgi:hypothetical protein
MEFAWLHAPDSGISESESDTAVPPIWPRRKGDECALCERTGRERTGERSTVGDTLSAGVDTIDGE